MQFTTQTSRRAGQSTAVAVTTAALGSALVLAAATASASIGLPSSGSSDAILFGEVLDSTGNVVASYAGDTGVSVTSLVNGTNTVKNALAGDANLAALFAADTAGDTLYWSVQGGQTQGANTSATKVQVPGYAQFLTTTTGNSLSDLSNDTTGNLVHWASGLINDVPNLNLNLNGQNSVEGASTTAAGLWDYTTLSGISAWYSNGPQTGNTALTANLYYVTGSGKVTSVVNSTAEDTLTLSANGLQFGSLGPAPDSYNLSTHLLTVPTLGIGSATYSNVSVAVESIITSPSGSSPNGTEDTYDPASGYLTVQSVTVGSATFHNAVVQVSPAAATTTIGSVIGADTYSGGQLAISEVQVGSHTYSNCIITVAGIVSLQGGLPQNAMDVYNGATGQLLVAAATFNGKVYTNVTVKVGTIIQVNGSPFPAVSVSPSVVSVEQSSGKAAVATNDNLRFRQ